MAEEKERTNISLFYSLQTDARATPFALARFSSANGLRPSFHHPNPPILSIRKAYIHPYVIHSSL